MRIVITGASGNVGTALIDRLLASGDHDLVAVARRVPAPVGDGVQWTSVGLSGDDCAPSLRRVVAGADAVVHLAWACQPLHRFGCREAVGVGGHSG